MKTSPGEKAPPRTTEPLKTPFRVACEQAILAVFERARSSLWTLKELRTALRAARRQVFARYGVRRYRPGHRVKDGLGVGLYVVGGPSAWRRAIVTVAGVPWRELREPKQRNWDWKRENVP